MKNMMKTASLLRRLALFALIIASPVVLAQCGNTDGGEQVPFIELGPKGPTKPGGYYFKMLATPSVLDVKNVLDIFITVVDSKGNFASGVPVVLSGSFEKADGAIQTTDSFGRAYYLVEIKSGTPGSYISYSARVEDKQLTVQILIRPSNLG